jgi:hypothetical protein
MSTSNAVAIPDYSMAMPPALSATSSASPAGSGSIKKVSIKRPAPAIASGPTSVSSARGARASVEPQEDGRMLLKLKGALKTPFLSANIQKA